MSQDVAVSPSLYQRLGAANSIRAAVDEFSVPGTADPLLSGYFAAVDMTSLRRHPQAMLSEAMGGRRACTGAERDSTPAGMGVTGETFAAVVGHPVGTVQHLGVQDREVDEVVAAPAPLRSTIVTA